MARDNGKPKGDGFDLVVDNRKARHDFFIEETLEAGLALTGTEVKSLRAHRANLRDRQARSDRAQDFRSRNRARAEEPQPLIRETLKDHDSAILRISSTRLWKPST